MLSLYCVDAPMCISINRFFLCAFHNLCNFFFIFFHFLRKFASKFSLAFFFFCLLACCHCSSLKVPLNVCAFTFFLSRRRRRRRNGKNSFPSRPDKPLLNARIYVSKPLLVAYDKKRDKTVLFLGHDCDIHTRRFFFFIYNGCFYIRTI